MEYINSWKWFEYEETGSTNDDVKRLCADADKGKCFVVTAKRQNSGRGRRGRSWVSLEGNLFVSFGLEVDLKDLGQMIFIVGLSLLETIKHLKQDCDVKLKWPNDVLVNNRKVSGILLEKGEGDYLIIGIGVNITAAPETDNLLYPAVSLEAAGLKTDRIEFLKEYINCFDSNLSEWEQKGFTKLKERWLENAKNLGGEINIHTENGVKEGIFNGVDDNGILLLETPQGIEKIYAGDVFFKEKNNK